MRTSKRGCMGALARMVIAVAVLALIVPGCVSSPENRTGEYFLFTKRQFRLVHEAIHANDSHANPFAVFAPFAVVGGTAVGLTFAPVVDVLCLPYDTYKKTDSTVILVLDEDGKPAPDVRVWMEFSSDFDKMEGTTGKNGEMHPYCDLRVLKISDCRLSGKGYYSSRWWHATCACPAIDSDNRILLQVKRIVNPVPMALGRVDFVKNAADFDCEYGDWLSPRGVGCHADLRFEIADGKRSVTALGPGAGLAVRSCDITSDLKSDNRVPDDLVFSTNRIEDLRISNDRYYIMRLRCETNEVGEVVRARYGKLTHFVGYGLNAYLNETVNEKSLEAKLGYNPVKDRGQRSKRMCHDWDINWP